MMLLTALLGTCVGAAPVLGLPAPAVHAAPAGYQLVWADEFEGSGRPDPASWTYESGFARNEELQWYQPDNASCENGMLVIEGRRERRPNPTYDPAAPASDWRRSRRDIEYTSTSMTTRGKNSWQYGRFEMRARIDVRPGLWPAFWMLGISGRWPGNGEIDIMEYYRGVILANVAWAEEDGGRIRAKWDDVRIPLAQLGGPGWADEFHVWRMDWDEKEIRIYLDDVLLNSADLGETINPDGSNPFHQPHYLLVNLAIGGTNGGDPSATTFPSRYEVDYVRVYQRR